MRRTRRPCGRIGGHTWHTFKGAGMREAIRKWKPTAWRVHWIALCHVGRIDDTRSSVLGEAAGLESVEQRGRGHVSRLLWMLLDVSSLWRKAVPGRKPVILPRICL
jgi:hypothetical protein